MSDRRLGLSLARIAVPARPSIWTQRPFRDSVGGVDERDFELRAATYGLFADRGHAPTVADLVEVSGVSAEDVLAGWRRLHDQHALVLDATFSAILMANPFSAVPTAFRVQADGRSWFANCAWDAFGICAALHVGGRIETTCPDCGDPVTVEVRNERPDDETLLFHVLVPAAQWWDDIVFT